jgi:hypothetical protein
MSEQRPYETQDARPGAVLIAGLVLLLVTAAAIGAMALLFGRFASQSDQGAAEPSPLAALQEKPSGPVLQVDPPAELAVLRAASADTLGGYGWVDPEEGIVRIPIARAMALLVKKEGRSEK